ncbi:MAG: hypothetical protein VKN72_15440 [Nostocales cyanobacterium 94392]|nr:hypothetical protein [Nostocales cyanobacterium 94392]
MTARVKNCLNLGISVVDHGLHGHDDTISKKTSISTAKLVKIAPNEKTMFNNNNYIQKILIKLSYQFIELILLKLNGELTSFPVLSKGV